MVVAMRRERQQSMRSMPPHRLLLCLPDPTSGLAAASAPPHHLQEYLQRLGCVLHSQQQRREDAQATAGGSCDSADAGGSRVSVTVHEHVQGDLSAGACRCSWAGVLPPPPPANSARVPAPGAASPLPIPLNTASSHTQSRWPPAPSTWIGTTSPTLSKSGSAPACASCASPRSCRCRRGSSAPRASQPSRCLVCGVGGGVEGLQAGRGLWKCPALAGWLPWRILVCLQGRCMPIHLASTPHIPPPHGCTPLSCVHPAVTCRACTSPAAATSPPTLQRRSAPCSRCVA